MEEETTKGQLIVRPEKPTAWLIGFGAGWDLRGWGVTQWQLSFGYPKRIDGEQVETGSLSLIPGPVAAGSLADLIQARSWSRARWMMRVGGSCFAPIYLGVGVPFEGNPTPGDAIRAMGLDPVVEFPFRWRQFLPRPRVSNDPTGPLFEAQDGV